MTLSRLAHRFGRLLRTPSRVDWGCYAALAAIACVAVGHSRLYAGALLDDSFITFRHAWNLVHGQGFTCSPGAHVEGTSSPLYALMMALPIALGMAPEVAATGLATLALAVCVGVAYFTVTTVLADSSSRVLGLGAAVLVAASPHLAFHSQTGLETVPYACLLALAICLQLRSFQSRSRSWAVVMGIVALTRPEGVVCFLCLLALAMVRRRGQEEAFAQAKRELVAFGCVWGPWLVFRLVYFGRLFPNSVQAKSGHVATAVHTWGDAAALLLHGAGTDMLSRYVADHGMAIALLLGALLLPRIRYAILLAVGLAVGYAAVATWNGGDWMPHDRLLTAAIVPLAVGSSLGLRGFLYHSEQKGRWHLPSVVLTIVALGILVAGTHRFREPVAKGLIKDLPRMREMGTRLASTRRPDDRVVSAMAGILPYYWGVTTTDTYGLCDAYIAKHGAVLPLGIGRFDPAYLVSLAPTFYVFEFSYLAAEFYRLPEFAAHRDEYFMLQYPFGYLGSTAFEPPVVLVRKDRPDVRRMAEVLGARLVDAGEELRRIGFVAQTQP